MTTLAFGVVVLGSELSASASVGTTNTTETPTVQLVNEPPKSDVTTRQQTGDASSGQTPVVPAAKTSATTDVAEETSATTSGSDEDVDANPTADALGGSKTTDSKISPALDVQSSADTTDLGEVSDTEFETAKVAAKATYDATNRAHKVTRVAAAVVAQSGTFGTAAWDLDADGLLTIHAGTFGKTKAPWTDYNDQIKSIVIEDGAIATPESNNDNYNIHLLGDLPNVTSIDASGLDTSQMTSMSHMFVSDPQLTTLVIDKQKFNTSQVTDMSRMFYHDDALTTVDVTGFDTSKVQTFYGMFEYDGSLTNLDVSGFNTSAATTMDFMFDGLTSVTNLDLTHFDTSHVTSMNTMLRYVGMTSLDVSHLDVSQVTNFESLFLGASLQKLDLSSWQMNPTADTTAMLTQMHDLWSLTVGPHTVMTNSGLDNAPSANTVLPDGVKNAKGQDNVVAYGQDTDGNKVTFWEAVGTGTEHDPEGELYATGDELSALYTGNGSAKLATYVWSQDVINPLEYRDVVTGEVIDDHHNVSYNGIYQFTNAKTNPTALNKAGLFPAGWHFATGAELGSYVQPEALTLIDQNGTVITMYLAKDAPTLESKTITKTVHYQDGDGHQLRDDFTDAVTMTKATDAANGEVTYSPVDATFKAQANPTIKGYTVVTNPVGAEATDAVSYGDDDVDYIVVYQKNAPTITAKTITKTVHYQDTDATELAPDFTDTAVITQSVDAVSGEPTYTATDDTLAGQANPVLTGYTVITNPANATTSQTVTFDDSDAVYTVVYQKKAPETATKTITKTIHYVDFQGQTLAPDFTDTAVITKTIDAVTGEVSYTSQDDELAGNPTPTFKGYQLTINPTQATTTQTVTFDSANSSYTVVYAKQIPAMSTVFVTKTVHYQDADGKMIAPDFTDTAAFNRSVDPVNDAVTYTTIDDVLDGQVNPEVTGYTVTTSPTNATTSQTVTAQTSDVTYTVIYSKDAPTTTSKVITKTVHYVNEQGQQIAPDFVASVTLTKSIDALTGIVSYSPQSAILDAQANPMVSGYQILTSSTAATQQQVVTFADDNQSFTVMYQKMTPPTDSQIDTDIDTGTVTTFETGTATSATPVIDDNETPQSTPTDTTITETVTSEPGTAVSEPVDQPDISIPESQDDNTVVVAGVGDSTTVKTPVTTKEQVMNNGQQLPQTSEKQSSAAVVGLGLMTTLFGFIGLKLKRKED